MLTAHPPMSQITSFLRKDIFQSSIYRFRPYFTLNPSPRCIGKSLKRPLACSS